MRAVETDGYIDLYLIGVDGSSLRRLTHDPERSASGPAWSPDGSRIAFTSFSRDEGIASIFVMDVDGSNLVRLTDRGAYDQTPSWSRDGSRIAFTGRREGRWDVFVMAADGSSIVNLTKNYHSDWIGHQAWGR